MLCHHRGDQSCHYYGLSIYLSIQKKRIAGKISPSVHCVTYNLDELVKSLNSVFLVMLANPGSESGMTITCREPLGRMRGLFAVKIHPPHPCPLPPQGGEGTIFMSGGYKISLS